MVVWLDRERDPPTWFYVERLVHSRQHKGAWPPTKQNHAWDAGSCRAMPSRITAIGTTLVRDVRGAAKCIESLWCLVLAQLKARCGTSGRYLVRHHARDKATRVCKLAGMALCGLQLQDTPLGESSKENRSVGAQRLRGSPWSEAPE